MAPAGASTLRWCHRKFIYLCVQSRQVLREQRSLRFVTINSHFYNVNPLNYNIIKARFSILYHNVIMFICPAPFLNYNCTWYFLLKWIIEDKLSWYSQEELDEIIKLPYLIRVNRGPVGKLCPGWKVNLPMSLHLQCQICAKNSCPPFALKPNDMLQLIIHMHICQICNAFCSLVC